MLGCRFIWLCWFAAVGFVWGLVAALCYGFVLVFVGWYWCFLVGLTVCLVVVTCL